MFVIRPIKDKDLTGLMNLLQDSGHGLTSLPRDEKILNDKITLSQRSFLHRGDRPGGEAYLFVMEEIFTGRIVGVSGLISKIGGFEAYYFYHLKSEVMTSKTLAFTKEVKSLHFEKTHSGPAEICSLFLSPEYRNAQNGRFLSLSRFLFMAENRKHFEDTVIAEMRGRVNDDGHSPFWDAVGHKFMNIDFVQADYLQMKSRSFIDELLPKYPILLDLLPEQAQEVVAKVHPHTEPAKKILEQEGFRFNGRVGIFEPGPVLEAQLDEIRALKTSRVMKVEEIVTQEFESDVYILCTCGSANFKAALGKVKILDNERAQIDAVTATALKLRLGDKFRFTTLKAS